RARESHGHLFAAAGVPDRITDRDSDDGGDQQGDRGVQQVLTQADQHGVGARVLFRGEQPGDRIEEQVHPANSAATSPPVEALWCLRRRNRAGLRAQGINSRPRKESSASSTIAISTVIAMPVAISAGMPRCRPFMNRYPRDLMPTSTPTVTRLTVLTVTTRRPASSAGPASGRSTAQNLRQGE